MKYKKTLSRRTFLRGAGTIAIGLPLLNAMRTTSVFASAPEPPIRAFNVFHGLGFKTALQEEGFSGPMEPLAPLRDKLLIVRNIDHIRANISSNNAHFDGSAGAFTAERPDGDARTGGPSFDQVLMAERYPNGQPAGVIPSVLMGTYFRRSRPARYINCWREDGSPAALPQEQPRDLFTRLFGSDPSLGDDDANRRRQRQSVLDSVTEQYRHFTSEASNLGVSSRARIADHLERIREYELRAFGDGPACERPVEPSESPLPQGSSADPGGDGIDVTLEDLVGEWRIMADLYALGVQCDLVRSGGMTFQAAGERIRLTGRYEHDGQHIYDFDDREERGTGGARGCSHEWWHDYNPGGTNAQLRAHTHLMMREVAYLLSRLDDSDHRDENGGTILENALVTVSTESGDGRHSDQQRELSGIFHAISGANGRFRTGELIDADAEGLDLYNTMLRAFGVTRKLGPEDRQIREVTAVLR